MENIDQLFRNKLEHHAMAPSEQAWDKMEAQLSHKNKFAIAWRAAAAIVVGGLVIVLLYWLTASPETTQPVLVDVLKPEKEIQVPATVEKNALNQELNQPQSIAKVVKERKSSSITSETKVEKTEMVEQPLEVKTHLMNEPNEITVAELSAAEKPMVIEFVLEEVPEKTVTAQVTPSEKETGIKKMWEAVKEIKNGDRTLDLRSATQELFASNKKENSKN